MADCKWCADEFCTNDQCPMCADYCPVADVPGVCKHEDRVVHLRYKDFEIRPTAHLDGHTKPNKFDVVKWYKTSQPHEVINTKTGKKEMRDTFCYSIAHMWWNEKEPCWEFESVGTRFLEDYENGLCEFVLGWLKERELYIERNEND